jgi:hypothetical protein
MTQPLEEQVDRLRRELSALEVPYDIAMKRERGEDKEWETRKRVMINRICNLVLKYKLGDEPHKAVAIVAEAGVLAAELIAPANVIEQYREKKEMLTMAVSQSEAMKQRFAEIEEARQNSTWMRRGA